MHKHAMKKHVNRREALGLLGAAGLAFAAGCGSSPTSATATTTSTGSSSSGGSSGGTSSAACAITPEETAGPYPDHTGMLTNQAFYRQDISEGKGGLPLTLMITIVNARNS